MLTRKTRFQSVVYGQKFSLYMESFNAVLKVPVFHFLSRRVSVNYFLLKEVVASFRSSFLRWFSPLNLGLNDLLNVWLSTVVKLLKWLRRSSLCRLYRRLAMVKVREIDAALVLVNHRIVFSEELGRVRRTMVLAFS